MGGPLVRHERTVHEVLLQDQDCELIFHNSGWLDYFLKLTKFNEEISRELTYTLSDGEAQLKGLRVVVIEERIAELTGLPTVGEKYPESKDACCARVEFT